MRATTTTRSIARTGDDQPDEAGDGPPGRVGRRRALGVLLGAAGAVTLAACGSGSSRTASASSTTTSTTTGGRTSTTSSGTASTDCTEIPEETAGPYPADGTNGPDVLGQDGVVRSDIRSSFGDASGTADGMPLTIELQVVDVSNSCAPLAGAAVYAWHCDRDGNYSLYSSGLADVNYLRGVQVTGSDGTVRFTSIFPACYSGRWPHVHFEVYEDLAAAKASGTPIATSQLALPKDVCSAVYATSGYEQSVRNLAQISLTSDNVFGDDGAAHQVPTVGGDVTNGYTAVLLVGVERRVSDLRTSGPAVP
jgi:protocatechuate 3,4-dioxygenase beta subunit